MLVVNKIEIDFCFDNGELIEKKCVRFWNRDFDLFIVIIYVFLFFFCKMRDLLYKYYYFFVKLYRKIVIVS